MAAADFGQAHWQTISTAITDLALQTRMAKALSDMAKAAAKQDVKAAAGAVQRELDLVDGLEAFVAKRR